MRFDTNDVLIALWPSPSEIYANDKNNNLYLGGLTTFYASLDELNKILEQNFFPLGAFHYWNTHPFLAPGGEAAFSPPEIVDFFAAGLGSGAFFALYKVLDLWVKKANGRRIKVKCNGFEIEATQLTAKQFEHLLQRVIDIQNRSLDERIDIGKELADYSAISENSSTVFKEKSALHRLAYDAREVLQDTFATNEEKIDAKPEHNEIEESTMFFSPVEEHEKQQESIMAILQDRNSRQEDNQLSVESTEEVVQQINMYISSASTPKDEALLDELEKQLSIVKRLQGFSLWQKRLIPSGANWAQEISTYINKAHLILFLISPDFFHSGQCYEEVKQAMERRNRGEVTVIPLLLRPTADWKDTLLGSIEALPTDREPISGRSDQDSVMKDIAERIRQVVEQIRQDINAKGS